MPCKGCEGSNPFRNMVSACLCQAIVRKTKLPCLRKTKAGRDFCGYHVRGNPPSKALLEEASTPDEDCSICLCAVEPLHRTTWTITSCCKHAFHKTCLNKWFAKGHNTCPLCRGVLKTTVVSQVTGTATTTPRYTGVGMDEFRQTHMNANLLMQIGVLYVAEYEQGSTRIMFILDTVSGRVTEIV